MTDEDFDYGPARSIFLTEVRTILSRAETALQTIKTSGEKLWLEYPRAVIGEPEPETREDRNGNEYVFMKRRFFGYTEGRWIPHPGYDDGVAALEDVVAKLDKFRKTRAKK